MAPSTLDRIFQSAASPQPATGTKDYAAQYSPDEIKDLPGGYKKLPNGIVLDKDGKPCRSCTSSSAWMAMMRKSTNPKSPSNATTATATAAATDASTTTTTPLPSAEDCPPSVEALGSSTWTLLHSIAATYPERAPASMQTSMKQFISTFSQLYPCWTCAEDFRGWMREPGNAPRVGGQEELGRWMCEAHNVVNVKLGKKEFDCSLWKERWRDGWADGRCG